MIEVTVGEIAQWTEAVNKDRLEHETKMIKGVSTDTRQIHPDQLFIALQGERVDGHHYINEAITSGAAAVLWAEQIPVPGDAKIPFIIVPEPLLALQKLAEHYVNEKLSAHVVAITGSNGKTTTKDLIYAMLNGTFKVHKTEGNFNNHIGLPLTILSAPLDTEVLILEMGMNHFGEIAKLSKLAQPDYAIITNIGEAHLMQLGSRHNIAKAKLEIIEGLKEKGTLIYFGDESLLLTEFAAKNFPANMKQLTFGEKSSNDWYLQDVQVHVDRTSFTVVGHFIATFHLRVPGKHQALNALAAVALGAELGLSLEQIRNNLASAKISGMRIERVFAWNGAIIFNDAYNASPSSVKAAVDFIASLPGYHRKWLVLGDMLELGKKEREFHIEIGNYLIKSKVDEVLLFGPLSKMIFETVNFNFTNLGSRGFTVHHFVRKQKLMQYLLARLQADDIVLIKASRSMKLEEVVYALQKGDYH